MKQYSALSPILGTVKRDRSLVQQQYRLSQSNLLMEYGMIVVLKCDILTLSNGYYQKLGI